MRLLYESGCVVLLPRIKRFNERQQRLLLAGRGLSAPFIAGSLLLTNLSAEQLIGSTDQPTATT